ncbi:hypothetical protein FHS31_001064 [Sphingomonas vulcanisoli]|uniref:Uncharacterized protein n=1 Tax=Sphingomonas vulcanisoli TaxID=1658060 RepID=A0ABX0TPK5_9SPHN|nr:hypothetical protein [Sphingomonas vulcanisoli]NIJ07468.1 hypothetical protein [Sphingomonas vulcanisoli]
MMVVLIVLILGITRIIQARYGIVRTGRGREERYIGPPRDIARENAEAEALRSDVRLLKDRIQVLERIVTDGDRTRGLSLEREIEALRDARESNREIKP